MSQRGLGNAPLGGNVDDEQEDEIDPELMREYIMEGAEVRVGVAS